MKYNHVSYKEIGAGNEEHVKYISFLFILYNEFMYLFQNDEYSPSGGQLLHCSAPCDTCTCCLHYCILNGKAYWPKQN